MEFHNVMVEKANAMRRYHRKRMLESALRFFNLCVALLVFSRSSWFPITLQMFWHFYAEFVSLFNHPFYVFLLGNVIILFIYALSNKNGGGNDVYNEFLNNTESRRKETADSESPASVSNPQDHSPVDSPHDEQTIWWETVNSPVSEESVAAVTETTKTRTTTTTSSCRRVSKTTNGEVSKSKCYRRVQSETYSRRIVVGSARDLKRLNTEVRCGGELERPLCSVENLSDEDFNRTVEDFIAKHRRKQWEEHREFQKTEYLALTH